MSERLRILRSKDYQLIAHLDFYGFRFDEPITDWYENTWWVAWNGDTAVGYAGIKKIADGLAMLTRAGVVKSFRGRGLQKKLIKTRLKWAKANNIQTVITDTVPTNSPSNNSLISCGFKLYVPEYQWKEEGALYWIRELKK